MAPLHGGSSPARCASGPAPVEVTTDRAPVYPRVIDELVPAARHVLEQYANNLVEADHGRLKARLRPMRGLKTIASLRTVAAGHAFVQNLRRGHYELTVDTARPRPTPQSPSPNSHTASDTQVNPRERLPPLRSINATAPNSAVRSCRTQ